MSGFPTGLWGSRREVGETPRNRQSISNAGSLKSQKLQGLQETAFTRIYVYSYHSTLISCGTSECYITNVLLQHGKAQLCKGLPALHAQCISS